MAQPEKDIVDLIRTRREYYNKFEDYSGKQFTHLLDYFSAQIGLGDSRIIPTHTTDSEGNVTPINIKDVYLGSFIKTLDDNEDPTYLGYDLKIKGLTSPLLNGTALSFITQFGNLGNSEIAARTSLLARFEDQLFRFLRSDVKTDPFGRRTNPTFDGTDGVKTYYLRKIAGLNALNEMFDGSEGKIFVDYPKQFITLTFNEDVTQNIGLLASLYKALSFSRINGKQILPENVLRFDVDIDITEVRKYNRIVKNIAENKLELLVDKISKYTYTLYECQFFFPTLPHSDTLDMSAITEAPEFEIKFNYKFSTLKFTKFTYLSGSGDSAKFFETRIDNKKLNPVGFSSDDTDNNSVENGSIVSKPPTPTTKSLGRIDIEQSKTEEPPSERQGELEEIKKNDAQKNSVENKTINTTSTDTSSTPPFPTTVPKNLSLKEKIDKASLQSFIVAKDEFKPTEVLNLKKALESVDEAAINPFPNNKFSDGILGGFIAKSQQELGTNVRNTANELLGKVDSVSTLFLNSIQGRFNTDGLGAKIGGALGSLTGQFSSTLNNFSISKIKSTIDSVNIGSILPLKGVFNSGLLGGGISGALNSFKNSAVDNVKGLFGSISSQVGSTLNNFSIEKIKSKIESVNLGSLLPTKGAFTSGLLSGGLSGALNSFKNSSVDKIKNQLGSIGDTLGSLGKALSGSGLASKLEQAKNSLLQSGALLSNPSGIQNRLNQAKNNLLNLGFKGLNSKIESQASLINKTLGAITSQKGPLSRSSQQQIGKQALQKVQNFVGGSLKSLFSNR